MAGEVGSVALVMRERVVLGVEASKRPSAASMAECVAMRER